MRARNDRSRLRQRLRAVIYGMVPLLAAVFAYLFTREPAAAAPQGASHDHGSGGEVAPARPVGLSPADAHRIGVTYAVATLAEAEREIRTVGQIAFDETRIKSISPRSDGWVEDLFVNFTGQQIGVGTPLFRVYSPMLVAAQEELLLAKRLESDITGGAGDTRAQASRLVASARSRLAQWNVAPEDIARLEVEDTVRRALVVRSPVAGFVVEKNVIQGQRIMAGDELYRIADLRRVWLEGEIYEQDMPLLRLGQRADAELQALPGTTFSGRVVYIAPTLDPETRTARVRIDLANERGTLKPGMLATVRLAAAGIRRALTVPRAAVVSTGERHLVFVKRADGMLEPRAVTVGQASSDLIEILAGLAAGDTVVASATFLVDAESSLGTALGGMGNMPGMDIVAPKKR